MPFYQQPHWSVELPEGWFGEREDESTLFRREGGTGNLSVTLLCDKVMVTREMLIELASSTLEEGHAPLDTQIGTYSGIYFSYEEEGSAWREWYLASGCCVFFVSYDCPKEDELKEADEVNKIVAHLILKQ